MDKAGEVVGGRTSNDETASWNSVAEKKEADSERKECLSNVKRATEQKVLDSSSGIATSDLYFFFIS